ncbi:hypothetical protein BP00DRAFT_433765 [Aspergillus indologenus CBS 114.80]|uniref:Uncharacterized protein n=1 Tax=Aspergillus indologenus CBS 114.80 TaxID=1450541 RepID=A0A2V5JEI1_9EURO|nr:hypothetical protein BP00DRAFT_433765 [Aspergillus indologenus CBS 114.80]
MRAAIPARVSNTTWTSVLGSTPRVFVEHIRRIAEGKNPNVSFDFTEVKVIRGTFPHPPHTDLQEVRNSITLQFNGAPGGPIVAHLFNDGTIKTSAEMHAENNRRREEETRLLAQESRFPELGQTAVRKEAERKMMAKIREARMDNTVSIIQKQLLKDSAQQEYNLVLQSQAQARAAAAESRSH